MPLIDDPSQLPIDFAVGPGRSLALYLGFVRLLQAFDVGANLGQVPIFESRVVTLESGGAVDDEFLEDGPTQDGFFFFAIGSDKLPGMRDLILPIIIISS